jgi:Fe2+ transport system protein FeoA
MSQAEALYTPAPEPAPLSSFEPGESGVIESVDTALPVGARLADLGFLPGTEIRVLRRAPFGDPTEYELRGYRICLRRSEAARVRVVPLETARP